VASLIWQLPSGASCGTSGASLDVGGGEAGGGEAGGGGAGSGDGS
jgi:hypothetical protein